MKWQQVFLAWMAESGSGGLSPVKQARMTLFVAQLRRGQCVFQSALKGEVQCVGVFAVGSEKSTHIVEGKPGTNHE